LVKRTHKRRESERKERKTAEQAGRMGKGQTLKFSLSLININKSTHTSGRGGRKGEKQDQRESFIKRFRLHCVREGRAQNILHGCSILGRIDSVQFS